MIAAAATRTDLVAAWRGGGWQIVLVGSTLGAGQTITFWESIKTLDTSLAALLFYTYPALTLVLDRVLARFSFAEVVASEHDILDGIAWSIA